MDRKNPDNNNCASSSLVSKYDVIVPSAGEIIVIPRNPVPIIEANNQSDIVGILSDFKPDELWFI